MSEKLLVLGIGVSVHKTDGALRFEHFCQSHGINYRVVGEGKEWKGGDMANGAGGGQKIKELLEAINDLENQLIVVCDTFDLVPITGQKEILDKYHSICPDNQVLFSSEIFCWPDKKLANTYPIVSTKYKYLNSGSFMGYRDDIYQLIHNGNILDNDDDQLFFTLKYLAGEKIILDQSCHLFQAINGVKEDLVVHKNRVYNKYTNSYPVFIHGNGPSKLFLNHLENYLETNPYKDYSSSITTKYQLLEQPKIFFALYIDSTNIKQYYQFIKSVFEINYDNKEIHIYDRNINIDIQSIIEKTGNCYYPNVLSYQFNHFLNTNCQYYFLLEQKYIITKKDILHELVTLCNGYKRIISPLLIHHQKNNFSNFWGSLDGNGYYRRSDNYFDLIERSKIGLWNIPYVSGVLLIDRSVIANFDLLNEIKYGHDNDMNLCYNCRKETIFMYMINNHQYGYIVD